MLTYLIATTRAIVMAAVILGVITGYTRLISDRSRNKALLIGVAVGAVISFIIAYLRNTTSKVNSANLNATIYVIGLSAFILFAVMSIPAISARGGRVASVISGVLLSILSADIIVYSFPEVWGYPYQVLLSEKTVLSTDFLLNMIGMIFGLILALVTFLSAMKCTMRISLKGAFLLLVGELILNALKQLAGILSVLQQRKIIVSNHMVFSYIIFIKNHSDAIMLISLVLLLVVTVFLWVRSFNVNEPYRNPAEHRKIRAKWRNIRRWSVTAAAVFAIALLNVTVVEAMNTFEVVLSPIEETEEDDENVYVPFELVSDGHLHRFAHTSENGTQIRFIVIQKPNSASYGVGLDACDICGETGYYEKDGQVVCNLCDVVMNINTIGFKGGCNPIVIPYEVSGGRIIVPIDGLLEYESEFK